MQGAIQKCQRLHKYTKHTFQRVFVGSVAKMLIPILFQHFRLLVIIFVAGFSFENMFMCTLYEGGRGFEKRYFLYTSEKVDIFGWPLS